MHWSSSPTPNTSNAGHGREAHQQHVGRGEVLELVDEEVAVLGLHGSAQRTVAQEGLDGAEDLLVEVDGAPPAQLLTVGPVRRGEAGHVVELGLDLLRPTQAQPDEREPIQVGRERDRC